MMEFGCPVADVSVWDPLAGGAYGACNAFRRSSISIINKLKPSLVIMSEAFTSLAASGRGQSGTISLTTWRNSLRRTLTLLHGPKMHKVLLGSTVTAGSFSPALCLAAYPTNVQKCTVSDSSGLAAERAAEVSASRAANTTYINVLPWLCSSSVSPSACSAIIGDATNGYRVVYYAAGHITKTYDLFLIGVLRAALKRSMS